MFKYFYTNVLAIAWMHKYFGMKFIWQCPADGFSIKEFSPVIIIPGFPYLTHYEDMQMMRERYIHPDSLFLLTVQDGDIINSGKIIQRMGISFMWPDNGEYNA